MDLFLEPKTEPFLGSKYIFSRGLNSRFHFLGPKMVPDLEPRNDPEIGSELANLAPKNGHQYGRHPLRGLTNHLKKGSDLAPKLGTRSSTKISGQMLQPN